MAPVKLRGMTWSHRRAIDPLVGTLPVFHLRFPQVDIEWTARPLSGFEFTSVDALASEYDLIILDHPFAGAIAASHSLLPLDDVLSPGVNPFVGPSLDTYRIDGSVWAVPVDAACQVGVSRPDLMARLDVAVPTNWGEVLALGEAARHVDLWLAIGLNGVHSLMTFFTLMANMGSPCATRRDEEFADRHTALEALAIMRDLLHLCPPGVLDWNSIELHDQMVRRDDLVFCPAVYCYATYAEADQRKPLRFHNWPGPRGCAGSTIGGTGLGVSARSRHPQEALAYARFAAELETQRAFAGLHGQPAHKRVWEDDAINQRFGGCYRDTRATIDSSWVRPRYNGYLTFQGHGGELLEAHLRGDIEAAAVLDKLQLLHCVAEGSRHEMRGRMPSGFPGFWTTSHLA